MQGKYVALLGLGSPLWDLPMQYGGIRRVANQPVHDQPAGPMEFGGRDRKFCLAPPPLS